VTDAGPVEHSERRHRRRDAHTADTHNVAEIAPIARVSEPARPPDIAQPLPSSSAVPATAETTDRRRSPDRAY
jgi:hypothetical protein